MAWKVPPWSVFLSVSVLKVLSGPEELNQKFSKKIILDILMKKKGSTLIPNPCKHASLSIMYL